MQNDIWKYGGSQSKLFQYLASGKPICSNLNMGYCLINKYYLGIAKPFVSAHDYSSAIMSLVNLNNEDYEQMCKRVREVAKRFDYELLVKEFSNILNDN